MDRQVTTPKQVTSINYINRLLISAVFISNYQKDLQPPFPGKKQFYLQTEKYPLLKKMMKMLPHNFIIGQLHDDDI